MNKMSKWAVCLDLTKMDNLLIGYINYLAGIIQPDEVRFVHIIESDNFIAEISDLFPELESETELENLIKDRLQSKISELFHHDDIKTSIGLRNGSTTDQIIKMMEEQNPDLLVIGKKVTYIGEGVVARRLTKYVPCSILFVPENARYSMKHITVPVDFSEQSANAVKLAQHLVSPSDGLVTAQHIYQYPKQFFPYMPDEKTAHKMDEELAEKKAAFLKDFKLHDNTDVELTLHREGKMSDEVYDLCVNKKSDMIVVAYKAKKTFLSTLKDNLADRMSNYNFGLPLFILKNKERNMKFFEKLIS